MKFILIPIFCLLFFSCREKIIPEPVLVVDFEIEQEFDAVAVVNKIQNAIKYDLDYGDGTKIIGDTTLHDKFIGVTHYYKEDGTYKIILTAYDKKGNSKAVEKQITVDYIQKNTAIANFSLKLLDTGVVQMINLSKNYVDIGITVGIGNWSYSTRTENPILEFDMNGTYDIALHASGKGYGDSKIVSFEVKNLIDRELGYFKGIWYGDSVIHNETLKESSYTQYNNGREFASIILNRYTIADKTLTLINKEVDNNLLYTNDGKYYQIKSKYRVGKQEAENWVMGFPIGYNGEIVYEDGKNKSIEILEIKEVPQAKIIPEMMDKAFWITYKIKADYGERGKIDGELKVRYLIYAYPWGV